MNKIKSLVIKFLVMTFLFSLLSLLDINKLYAATSTSTVTLTTGEWTEVGDAGENVIITPLIPYAVILISYSATKPLDTDYNGHYLKKNNQTYNALLGSVNTNKIWCRTYLVNDVDVVVTIL